MHPKLHRFSPPFLLFTLFVCSNALPSLLPMDVGVELFDPTLPPVAPTQTPKCSIQVLQHEFSAADCNSFATTSNYTQPDECPAPWTRVVLEVSLAASGGHKDRVAAVSINGAEILRSSTPLTIGSKAYWKVQKDVTRYTSLLSELEYGGKIAMIVQNNTNSAPSGVLAANVTLHFYRGPLMGEKVTGPTIAKLGGRPAVKGLYHEPADLIIPISRGNNYNEDDINDDSISTSASRNAFWFHVNDESDSHGSSVTIPRNTYRAILEIFASYHGDDKQWYGNPLQESTIGSSNSNGGLRQIYATIDGKYIGSRIPFAVIYPGSVNPYYWTPVTAIGSFDLPSYDLEITPLLNLLLDGQSHEIAVGVKGGRNFWLLSGNLHLWIDRFSDAVTSGIISYSAPPLKVTRHAEWGTLDGSSEVDAEGLMKLVGWVSSSKGNLTTMVRQKVTFKSQVEVQNRGAVTQVEMINKERMEVWVHKGNLVVGRVQVFMEAPLQVQTSRVLAAGGAIFEKGKLYHQLSEVVNLNMNGVVTTSTMTDRQDAEGSVLMHDGTPVWGSGSTRSTYQLRDENTCYLRTVNTLGGIVKDDISSPSCDTVADA
ncbi:peptide-N4-(N-acetyl-beta-glucosaminyl)asparagine amidase A-like [Typha angustifolia]|uniref:peptide-N4-(N-acetyl-beta- glucosaminyl)asparagine amidase A-like n=1 Tax=Typha angustifolia TaxID=59011 RepID=UPI003C2C91B4